MLTFDTQVQLKAQPNGLFKANYFINNKGKLVMAELVNEIEARIILNAKPDNTWNNCINKPGWYEKNVLIEELKFYN